MNATLLQILPAVLLAMMHPMLGLIFAFAISGKTLVADTRRLLTWSLGVLTVCALGALTGQVAVVRMLDIAAALTLSMAAFAYAMRRWRSWIVAILAATGAQAVYAVVRRLIFVSPYRDEIEAVRSMFAEIEAQEAGQYSADAMDMMREVVEFAVRMHTEFQEAIWVAPLLVGLYLGALLLSKRVPFGWRHSATRMPYWLVYVVLGGLALSFIGQTKLVGYNVLMIVAWAYFIQGMMIIDFYWGKYFARSKAWTFVFILAIMVNYFLIGLIMMMGLLDAWFNFRKLQDMHNMEDNSGDHSHTGDL